MKPYSIVPALALIAHTAFAAEGLPREIQALSQQPCEEIRKEMTEDLRECRLAHAGAVGTVDEHEFFFAVYHVALKGLESPAPEYCLGDPTPQTYFCEASALFERYHGQSRLFKTFWTGDIGLMHYDRPRIVVREGAPILYIPIPWDGTGHGNGSEYYVWNGEWRLIDSTQWLKELTQRLPTGLTIMTGVWPDLATLTADVPLYKEGDSNCCPTGGLAHIQLSISSAQFVVDSVSVSPGKPH